MIVTAHPFHWTVNDVFHAGLILGASIYKDFDLDGLKTELKVGILGAMLKKASDLSGCYYYVVCSAKDFIFGLDVQTEIGYNSHFFAPEGKDFCANVKISNQWQLFQNFSAIAYAQYYFTDDKRINPYNELSAGLSLSIKII